MCGGQFIASRHSDVEIVAAIDACVAGGSGEVRSGNSPRFLSFHLDFKSALQTQTQHIRGPARIYTAHQAYSDWRYRTGHGTTPTHSHIAVPSPDPFSNVWPISRLASGSVLTLITSQLSDREKRGLQQQGAPRRQCVHVILTSAISCEIASKHCAIYVASQRGSQSVDIMHGLFRVVPFSEYLWS